MISSKLQREKLLREKRGKKRPRSILDHQLATSVQSFPFFELSTTNIFLHLFQLLKKSATQPTFHANELCLFGGAEKIRCIPISNLFDSPRGACSRARTRCRRARRCRSSSRASSSRCGSWSTRCPASSVCSERAGQSFYKKSQTFAIGDLLWERGQSKQICQMANERTIDVGRRDFPGPKRTPPRHKSLPSFRVSVV